MCNGGFTDPRNRMGKRTAALFPVSAWWLDEIRPTFFFSSYELEEEFLRDDGRLIERIFFE